MKFKTLKALHVYLGSIKYNIQVNQSISVKFDSCRFISLWDLSF